MKADIYIEDILNGKRQENDALTLRGWVYNTRSSGKVRFLELRDGTATIQCVLFKGNSSEAAFAAFETLTQECSVEVHGTLSRSPKGVWEMQAKELKLIGVSKDFPITPKEHGPAFLQDHRHLWIRSNKQHATLRIRSEVIAGIREFFDDQGYVCFDAPIFTPNACEGTTNLFQVNYFDDKAYLTQSGQLYGEAGAMAFGKIYVFGPTFRAEKSKTRRHLTEFWMVEPEVAFMDLEGAMELAEDMICHVVERVLRTRKRELQTLERPLPELEKIRKPFPRLAYVEAAKILEAESKDNFKAGMDFGGGDETILASKFDRPVFVHRFPTAIKAFYMKEDPKDAKHCLSFDLLAPEGYGEIIGGAQREEDIGILQKKMSEHGLDQKVFEWYLDLRRYGSVPHAGFGLGVERFTAWICGTPHVRETIPFPRMLYRLHP